MTTSTVAVDLSDDASGLRSTGWERGLAPAGIVIIAAAIALAAVDLERLSANRTAMELLIGLSTLSLFGLVAATRPTIPRRPETIFLTAWVLWAAIAPLAHSPVTTLATAGRFAAILAAALGLAQHSRRTDPARLFARIIAVGFVMHVVLSVGLIRAGSAGATVGDRLALTSLESNQLARAAAISAVAGLWLLSTDRRVWAAVGAGVAVLGGGITLATQSRTALAALAAAVVVLAVHNARARLVALALGAALLITAAWASGLVMLDDIVPATERISVEGSEASSALSGRENLWPKVWSEVERQPITGRGLGNDRSIVVDELEVGWEALHAHNLVLHTALTTGVVGVALLLAAITSSLATSARSHRSFELALIVLVALDGVSEPVVRIPAFGWFALCSAAIGCAQSVTHRAART